MIAEVVSETNGYRGKLHKDVPIVGIVGTEVRYDKLLDRILKQSGSRTFISRSVVEALELFDARNPDLLIVHNDLPFDGAHFLVERLRDFSKIPIMFIDSKPSEERLLRIYDTGADCYRAREELTDGILVSSARALLRRASLNKEREGRPVISNDDLTVDLQQREIRRTGERIHVTPTEFKIAALLAVRLGQALTHDKILSKVWGVSYVDEDPHLVHVQVCRLREKIEHNPDRPRYIRTIGGIGYKMPNLNIP